MRETLLLDRYRILGDLGTGGFGETFLAEDTYMPSKRRCVIKRLKSIAGSPQIQQMVQQRFQREAAILEELGQLSPQIPELYAYFQLADQFYLVQEWIDGLILTDLVSSEGPLSETAVREILVSLLPVLTTVHSQGIVHRDIKPDNIILRRRDRQPVLVDFGAVKETMATAVNSTRQSRNSMIVGTPGFMASEQAAGRPVYSSDLYSLALTAIYLLTGKMPQELEIDPHSCEIIWDRSPLGLDSILASVLEIAIKSRPHSRFSTAREMLAALQGADAAVSKLQSTVVISPSSRKSPAIGNSPGIALWGTPILAAMGIIALWQTPYLQPPLPVTDPKPLSPSELPPAECRRDHTASLAPQIRAKSAGQLWGGGDGGDFAGYCRPPSDATLLA
ncbi:MAG: serine/threonine protein kinase [Hormoscilla sp. SP5CHS1]|nr:serine/threonine protein kinase [Hormoscilla sp. SP5CHS1]